MSLAEASPASELDGALADFAPDERYPEQVEGYVRRGDQFTIDLRTGPPDLFKDISATNWDELTWEKVGDPYKVEKWASSLKDWERDHEGKLPVQEGWKMFNKSFHQFFVSDPRAVAKDARNRMFKAFLTADIEGASEAWQEFLCFAIWNRVHRVQDAVWDPRGKRALFEGLDVEKPRVLFLGASDGYEAMQLLAMYPGGSAVLADYDEFCATDRFGKFPLEYPFLGANPATGGRRVWHRDEMNMEYVVSDIRDLDCGPEFDVVVSIGLVEHFPDEYKPLAMEWHRKFLKPGGYAIITTPRNQLKSRAFYNVMSDYMNFGYRELMTIHQLGLHAHKNGFEILRAGYIKAHNGLICKAR
jgi:SAM-dependent methyltransferase